MANKSWRAVYRYVGPEGGYLLGGVLVGQSSRWGEKADAQTSLESTIEINGGPSRCVGEVKFVHTMPEIFRHCPGHPAQVIGGVCFGCRKVLTWRDALAHKEEETHEETHEETPPEEPERS